MELSEGKCFVCGRSGGKFERVTYIDAPIGGVAMHAYCMSKFFAWLEESWYNVPPLMEKPNGAS